MMNLVDELIAGHPRGLFESSVLFALGRTKILNIFPCISEEENFDPNVEAPAHHMIPAENFMARALLRGQKLPRLGEIVQVET